MKFHEIYFNEDIYEIAEVINYVQLWNLYFKIFMEIN